MRRLLSLILMLGASTSLFAQTYCTPAYTTGCSVGDQIESFSTTLGLTNITNLNTGCSPAYYTYYNTLTASQVQGGSIDFTVVAGSAYNQGFTIYVDWNNDGDFDDVGENVWNSGSSVPSATGSFTIPLTATPGLKRMRVRSNWNALPLGPCVSQSYGEAEDYNLDVISLGPCTAPPTAGFAVASDSSICVNNTIFLSLNGFSVGSGQTYQWQSSLDGVTFTDMVGDTLSYATATISDTLWFQCIVTCSGQSATSSVVNVFSIGNPLSGTYTVNPALPSAGTNFASFGDLATALECGGVGGPVTVNVTGGVYNEQFTFTGWTGASSVNTVTIQPDPASSAPVEVVWAPTGSGDNYVIEFVDVEHLTINSLNFIDTANPAYSRIFYFTGTCSNLSFDGNSFQGSAATSNSTNTALIYESATAINNLSFTNNSFNGGSYATYLLMTSSNLSDTLIFTNNSINTLAYGLYTGYWTYVEALDNDIVLTGGTTNYAIRTYGVSSGTAPVNTRVRIEGNSIQMNGSSTLYGIYIYYMNSLSNDPSTVINNMVYCSPTSSSTNYGIYSYHLANTNIYHNSFDVEAGSTTARCAYFSGSTSTSFFVPGNVDVRNNIFANYGAGQLIYVTGVADDGGYFGNINSNLYYATGANWFYYGANVADLTAWQTATGYDAASVTGDPLFIGNGDLHVLGGAANDAGDNGVGVFSDIDGDPRPYPGSTIVDIGADEYEPVGCLPPVNATISNVTANSADVSWQPGSPVQLIYEIQYGPTGFTPGSGTTDLAFGTSYSIINLAPQTTYDVYLTEICSFTDSSIQIGPYTFTTNCVPAVAPYSETFDDASWTPDDINFSSVNDVFNPCWTPNPTGTTYSWHVRSTPTGSSSTGPSSDNSGSGNYIYVEASNGSSGDMAEVLSPLIDISALTTPELVFHYHAYGPQIDSLFIEVSTGSGWVGLDTLVGAVQTSSSDPFIPHTVGLAGYSGTIQLRWRARSGGCCSGDLAIDDVTVDNAPACPNPSFITALNATGNSIDLGWTNGSAGATNWVIEYGLPGFTLGTGTVVSATTNPFTIPGLQPNTTYEFYVAEVCPGGADSSNFAGPATSITGQIPVTTFPYLQDWENGPGGWTIANGSATNQWVIGSATSNGSGTQALYISNDNGVSNAYTINSTSIVHAYRDFQLPSGNAVIDLSFDWQALAEACCDYLKVWVVPTNFVPTPGALISATGTAPTGRIQLGGNFNQSATWNSELFTLPTAYDGQSFRLVLEWRNDGSVGTMPSGAFDNIAINLSNCPAPFNVAVTTLTNSVDVTWTPAGAATTFNIEWGAPGFALGSGTSAVATTPNYTIPGLTPQTSYEVYIQSDCGADSSSWTGPIAFTTACATFSAPFIEGLNSGSLPSSCWANFETSGSTSANDLWKFTGVPGYDAANNGKPSGSFAWVDGSIPNTGVSVLETPLIDLSSMPAAELNFELYSNNITYASSGNMKFFVNFWDGAQWNDSIYTFMGNNPTWMAINVPLSSFTITGDVKFQFCVDQTTAATAFYNDILLDEIEVVQPPACPNVTSLQATGVNTTTSIELAWVEGTAGATSWEVQYGPAGFALGSGTTVTAGSNPYTVGNLAPGNSYDFYVRELCPNGVDFSNWVGPVGASTPLCDTTNQCVYTVDLYDTWGDGWNGNDFGFVQNGVVVSSFTLASGDSLIGLQVPLCDGIPAELQLLASGSYQYEIYMNIYDPSGALVFALPSGGSFNLNDSIFGTTPNCGTLVSQACDDFEGYTPGDLVSQSSYWESWDGGAQDAAVVASPTHGGNAALQIHTTGTNGFTDILFNPASQSSGVHELSFWFNIPAANGGYFSLMHDYTVGGTNTWAAEVLLDGTNGQGSIDYGSSAGGNIANFNFNPGAWNEVRVIIDLDQDQAQMILNGLSVANWVWSDGQSGVYGNFSAVNLYSFAPGALTPLMYVDDFCFGDYVPVCNIATAPAGVDVDGCDGQPVTLSATPGDTNTYVVWLDALNTIAGSGDNFTIDSLIANTTLQTIDASPSAPAEHVGPLPSIAANGFGNFTNGIYATAITAFRLDSILLKSNDALDVRVNVWTDQPSAGGVVLQQSELISLPAAGEHQVAVDLTVQPGNYFFNIDYISGAGQLFRADGGASFPYVFTDVVSLDSINFANQLRYYYLFDWVVTPVCLGTQATAITANLNPAPAASFTSSSVPGCTWDFDASASSGDTYTWDFGDGASGTGATTSHTYSADGSYSVALTVTNNCGSDTYTETLVVDCSSLSEQALQQLRAFPNPTTGELFVELQTLREERIVVKITNPAGQNILTQAFDQPAGVFNQRFDLSDLAKGVYFLHVEANNQAKVLRITLQ